MCFGVILANLNLCSLCLGDHIVHYLYYITIKMTAWENQMIIALIINVKIIIKYNNYLNI